MKRLAFVVAALLLVSGPVFAGGLVGTWLTEPDAKSATGHVVIQPCGGALCGTIVRAFDKAGNPIITPNVGKRILWDVRAQGNAGEGQVYVPGMRLVFPVSLTANGDRLNLRACNALGLCRTQVWKRVN